MNWRDRRNFLAPSNYPFASYCTDSKSEMKSNFGEDLFLNSLYLGADPLRKNLADTIITEKKMADKNNQNKLDMEKEELAEKNTQMHVDYSPLAGITSFFSGVLNVISNAMFNKRKPDEFSCDSGPEMALPSMWHGAKISDENKILRDEISNDMPSEIFASEMSDCLSAAAQCQGKLDRVRVLLGNSKPVPCSVRVRRRPKKVFVEPNSVEDCFEDAFSPEDFENLADDSCLEYYSPICCQDQVFTEIQAPEVKVETGATTNMTAESQVLAEPQNLIVESTKSTDILEKDAVNEDIAELKLNEHPSEDAQPPICESTEIVKDVPESDMTNNKSKIDRKELIESCEDKISKLKLLLQERRRKPNTIQPVLETESEPTLPVHKLEPNHLVTLPPRPKPNSKIKDKHFKNPNRTNVKRRKLRMRRNIDDDMLFANEINTEDLSSVENSPSTNHMENYMKLSEPVQNHNQSPKKEYFDEVCGRFQSSSVDSDDSFQIVFNDCSRYRRQSDCDSEDSFIFFEDSPDSCYTSNDVFGDSSESEDCDSDSDMSDSGCGVFKLSASLSKSVNNLTDDSLYVDHSEDEVDSANVHDFGVCDAVNISEVGDTCESKGLLLTDRKKLMKRNLPAKQVHFSTEPPKVHVMRVWLFAAKQTRQRYWEQFVVDRERFKRRIDDVDMAVSWVLKPQHRSRVMFQRFMPWWNAQKRLELAEKKEKEAQEKDRLKIEEAEKDNVESKKEINVENSDKWTWTGPIETDKLESDHIDGNISKSILEMRTVNATGNTVKSESKEDENAVAEKEGNVNDLLTEKDADCVTPKGEDLKEDENEKNMSIENVKNSSSNNDENIYNSQIVPYNEKIVDLRPEYVSGILDT